jgi:hypothetical protein
MNIDSGVHSSKARGEKKKKKNADHLCSVACLSLL